MDAMAGDLQDSLDEIERITGGVVPAVLEPLLRGNTRITGAWTHTAFEADVQPMRDHVLWATHSGTGIATALIDGRVVTGPSRSGSVRIIPRGQGSLWRIDAEE